MDHRDRNPLLKAIDIQGEPNLVIAAGTGITGRERLQQALLNISPREQRRIGQDLHDGLGQHLTGIAFLAKAHQATLAEKHLPEAAEAGKIVQLVNQAIHKTRELTRGLLPVVADGHGLMSALQLFAAEVESLYGISCRFEFQAPVFIHDESMATHLYRIAQESVNNAIKHGLPSTILIRLNAENGEGALQIKDDGCGIAGNPGKSPGMGLHIMRDRAARIGGALEVVPDPLQGTTVTCTFPLKRAEEMREKGWFNVQP